MYSVKLYDKGNCFVDAPFESRDKALKYFNRRIDAAIDPVFQLSYDRIEIWNDNVCLFDYEV